MRAAAPAVLLALLAVAPTAVQGQSAPPPGEADKPRRGRSAGTPKAGAGEDSLMLSFGLRSGGEIESVELGRRPEFDATLSYGLTYNRSLGRETALEFVWSRQDTDVEFLGLFPDSPEFGVTIDYLHAGALYRPYKAGRRHRPYVGVGVGLTGIDPDRPEFDTDWGFSMSIGGGTTFPLHERVGLRLLGRAWLSFSEGSFKGLCGGNSCQFELRGEGFAQYEGSLGIVFNLDRRNSDEAGQ